MHFSQTHRPAALPMLRERGLLDLRVVGGACGLLLASYAAGGGGPFDINLAAGNRAISKGAPGKKNLHLHAVCTEQGRPLPCG